MTTATRTFLVLPLLAHELEGRQALQDLLLEAARAQVAPTKVEILQRRLRPGEVSPGGWVVADCLARLGTTPLEALKIVHALLLFGCTIFIPNVLTLRPGTEAHQQIRQVLELILSTSRRTRARKIRESLFLLKQRGHPIGRQRLPAETVRLALEELDLQNGNIRGAARALRNKGIEISRSALGRLALARRNGGKNG